MELHELYKGLNVLANADGTDDYFGIDDFNRKIPEEQLNFIIDVMEEERKRGSLRKPMTDYLLAATTKAASATYYNWELPGNYLRTDSMVYISATSTVPNKPVELISAAEYVRRCTDVLAPPMEENYVAYIEEGDSTHQKGDSPGGVLCETGRWILCFPQLTTGTWGLFYIKKPTDPFLDYYIDADGDIQFMSEPTAGNHTLAVGEVYRDGTTTGTITSATVELTIPIEFHDRFMERLIERLGIKDRDNMLASYGISKDQQDKTNV
jgi:hypothetical protein